MLQRDDPLQTPALGRDELCPGSASFQQLKTGACTVSIHILSDEPPVLHDFAIIMLYKAQLQQDEGKAVDAYPATALAGSPKAWQNPLKKGRST